MYNYRVYGKTYFTGYEHITEKHKPTTYEEAKSVVDSLDIKLYNSYLIIRHDILQNMDEPIESGYLDSPIQEKVKRKK